MQSNNNNTAIELVDVVASSGGYEILANANISFPSGLCSVVMGSAGSGKSTLLKVAAGLVVPDFGQVLWNNRDMSKFSRSDELNFRADTGFIFQDAALWADSNILTNVAMPLRLHKPFMNDQEIVLACTDLLKKLGYDESLMVRPSDLSTGEQKIVSIARAVIHLPSIVFMDDPTSGIDEDTTDKIFMFLDELVQQNKTIIIVTAQSEIAYRFADYLGVLKTGKLIAFGPYENIINNYDAISGTSISRLKAKGNRAIRRNLK